MRSKGRLIVYWLSTLILSLIMVFSVFNYFFNHDFVREAFLMLGYPTYLIYPLAVAKVLGLFAIWSHKSSLLEEWAYAGFFFNTLLAIFAHVGVGDGGHWFAVIVFAATLFSYVTRRG